MIGKIPKPGKSFKGLLEYNLMRKEATILDADGIRIDKIAHTINDFNMQRKMNPNLGQAAGHIALSWSLNDLDKLNDEVMTDIAKEYLQKMKIQDTIPSGGLKQSKTGEYSTIRYFTHVFKLK